MQNNEATIAQAHDLHELQKRVEEWEGSNYPGTQEWELALGVCEEAGELAQCVLKMYREERPDEASPAALRREIGDVVIFLMGLCSSRGWRIDDVVFERAEEVLTRVKISSQS